MTNATEKAGPVAEQKPSTRLHAVITIVQADPELERLVMPHICLSTEAIDWQKIYSVPFSDHQKAAITWCLHLWADRVKPKPELSHAIPKLENHLRRAVLQAVGLRWELV